MKISREEVQRVAELSRLEFSESELGTFTDQLGDILEYIEKLGELETDGVEPTAHILDLATPLREDTTKPLLGTEEALANAPETHDGYFTVPNVIE